MDPTVYNYMQKKFGLGLPEEYSGQEEQAPALSLPPPAAVDPYAEYKRNLADSMGRANNQQLMADLSAAANTAASAMAGVKADNSFYENIGKRGQERVDAMRAQNKENIALKDRERQLASWDPKSSISSIYRTYAKRQGADIPEDVSAAQLHEMGIRPFDPKTAANSWQSKQLIQMDGPDGPEYVEYDKADGSMKNIGAKGYKGEWKKDPDTGEWVKFGRNGPVGGGGKGSGKEQPGAITFSDLHPVEKGYVAKAQDKFDTDMKPFDEFKDQMNRIDELVRLDNPAATGAIQNMMARVVGMEKGPLSDSDIARQAGDPSIMAKFQRALDRSTNGVLPAEDKQNIMQITATLRGVIDGDLARRRAKHVQRLQQRIPRADEKSAADLLGLEAPAASPAPAPKKETASVPQISPKDAAALKWLKSANPEDPNYKNVQSKLKAKGLI